MGPDSACALGMSAGRDSTLNDSKHMMLITRQLLEIILPSTFGF
jgi:hypothetical protein